MCGYRIQATTWRILPGQYNRKQARRVIGKNADIFAQKNRTGFVHFNQPGRMRGAENKSPRRPDGRRGL